MGGAQPSITDLDAAAMRSLLQQAGHALYGPRWQSDMARALNVGDRRIRAWIAGERPIPAGLVNDLIALLSEQATQITDVLAALRRCASGSAGAAHRPK